MSRSVRCHRLSSLFFNVQYTPSRELLHRGFERFISLLTLYNNYNILFELSQQLSHHYVNLFFRKVLFISFFTLHIYYAINCCLNPAFLAALLKITRCADPGMRAILPKSRLFSQKLTNFGRLLTHKICRLIPSHWKLIDCRLKI